MPKTKLTIDFTPALKEMITDIDRIGGNAKPIVEKALRAAHEYMTPNIRSDMAKHNQSGITARSILSAATVRWEGNEASIQIGFDLKNGGFPSIFLMYGTPKMQKDTKLFNDVYGSRTKRAVREMQEQIFKDELERLMR